MIGGQLKKGESMVLEKKKIHTNWNLEVWQNAIDLVEKIYELTTDFLADEKFEFTSQMRWAIVSISPNIAEGFGI